MRVGNLSGLGAVYDTEGNPILQDGEEVLREVARDNLLVRKGKSRLFGDTLLDFTKEKGTLYLTNRRLIFLRTPDEWKKFRTYGHITSMDLAFSEASYARELKAKGGMEYVELPYTDVESFKAKKGKWADLHLCDEDGVPLRVMLDRRDRKDDKIKVLEDLLLEAGAEKLN